MSDLTGNRDDGNVECLPILVSLPDMEFQKLLSMPKLPAGTGLAAATMQSIKEWKLEERIKPLCFDTTIIQFLQTHAFILDVVH